VSDTIAAIVKRNLLLDLCNGRKRNRTAAVSFSGLNSTIELSPLNFLMAKFLKSRYKLTKRYARYSTYEIYLNEAKNKKVRFGYKVYQKIFKRYRSKKTLRINVRKPRLAVKRKTYFGKAMEMKNKLSYLLGGIHSSKLSRFVRLNYSRIFSSSVAFADALESRLDVVVAKTSLLPYSNMIRPFIKSGNVRVNGKIVKNVGFTLKKHTKFSIRLPLYLYSSAFKFFKSKIRSRLVFWSSPSAIEFSYITFSGIKYAKVRPRDIVYPFNFDINYFYRLYPR
jgi:ribosomal protein S4